MSAKKNSSKKSAAGSKSAKAPSAHPSKAEQKAKDGPSRGGPGLSRAMVAPLGMVLPEAAVPQPDDHGHHGTGSSNPDMKPEIRQVYQSPNQSARNGATINMVVLHCTEASLPSTIGTFMDGSKDGRQVSAHYVIDRNGDIYQMVPDSHRANHCKGANANSIGIEHVASPADPLTPAQSQASASLVRWLLQQYDIPAERVFGHDFAPGYSGGGTSCPDALFGAHTQQAVQDWVAENVIVSDVPRALPVPEEQPVPGSKLVVTASSLNVRATPALDGAIVGSLARDAEVGWLAISDDGYWAKVQSPAVTGWASRRYLMPPMATLAPAEGATPAATAQQIITAMAGASAIARYDWPKPTKRGVAPAGYIKGMALVYARLYCKFRAGDPVALHLARANSGDSSKDVLAYYAKQFHEAGMDNESSGVDTLRHLIVLMVGLGMRESSGRYCEGRDRSADNTTASTAEAGMLQTSYNACDANPLMPEIFARYQADYAADPAIGFVNVFKEGVVPHARDLENFGTGPGRDFQELSKECPAFAAELCAVGLRNIRNHWGPINNRAAEIRPECNKLFSEIERVVDDHNLASI